MYRTIVEHLEASRYFVNLKPFGEPQLGRRGLYEALGGHRHDVDASMAMLWLLNQSDGTRSLYAIAQRSGIQHAVLADVAACLVENELLEPASDPG